MTYLTLKASNLTECMLPGPSPMLNAAQSFGLKVKLHKHTHAKQCNVQESVTQ